MKRPTVAEALMMHARQMKLTRAANKREMTELRELLTHLEALIVRTEGLLRAGRAAPRAQA